MVFSFGLVLAMAKPGDHFKSADGYSEYIEGDLPLIFAVPHGGTLLPAAWPDRVKDTAKAVPDLNTEELAKEMANQIRAASGHFPHVVLCHLHRLKLDPNRDSTDTLEPPYVDAAGKAAWKAYHGFLEAARIRVETDFGEGLLLDLHGHQHAVPRVELGYLILDSQLRRPDSDLYLYRGTSSLAVLSGRTTVPFAELVRGPRSFGGYLQAKGIPAVPGPLYPSNDTNPYFSGGYTIKRHCLLAKGRVSGFQMELPFAGFRDGPASRKAYAAIVLESLGPYMKAHFGRDLPALTGIAATGPKARPRRPEAEWRADGRRVGKGGAILIAPTNLSPRR